MNRPGQWLREPGRGGEGDAPIPKPSTAWNPEALARATNLRDDIAWQAVLGLENAGFARSRPMSGFSISEPSTGYLVSDLGKAVLEVLTEFRAADAGRSLSS
jgi:hypothetical protein